MSAVQLAGPTVRPRGLPAWSRQADISDYGGSLDKVDSTTEGDRPYAWLWYRELQAMRGSAYSSEVGGTLVHAENLALARLFAGVFSRLPEKIVANSVPSTSDEKLSHWVTVLRVRTNDGDTPEIIRNKCSAKFKLALGPTELNTDEAVRALLGNFYTSTVRNVGSSLAAPPTPTHWPGIDPGPSSYDLGGGTWLSSRKHLVVVSVKPASGDEAAWRELMNVQLFDLLDTLCPADATFNYSTSASFILDVSRLDFDGLGS